MKGKLIFFEGIDGSGKTTHWQQILKSVDDAWGSSQPNDVDYCALIKEAVDPVEQAMLYAGDRRREMHYCSRRLDEGGHVISDRGPLSMFAYQGTAINRVSFWHLLEELNKWSMERVEVAATIIFCAPLDVCLRRISCRQPDTDISTEASDELARVHAYYDHVSDLKRSHVHHGLPWLGQVHRVDTDRPVDIVQGEVLTLVQQIISGV